MPSGSFVVARAPRKFFSVKSVYLSVEVNYNIFLNITHKYLLMIHLNPPDLPSHMTRQQ